MASTANTHAHPPIEIGAAVARARAEFIEMPGLRLTADQARRLWTLDTSVCEAVLNELLETRFLRRSAGDSFMRRD